MKKAILFELPMAGVANGNARWSNTTSQFYDLLDMPVARAASDQRNPMVIKGGQPEVFCGRGRFRLCP